MKSISWVITSTTGSLSSAITTSSVVSLFTSDLQDYIIIRMKDKHIKDVMEAAKLLVL